jgi:L-aspartate oxidase
MTHMLIDPATAATYPRRMDNAVVIGAGVAGLTFALHLPADRRVLLLTKGELGESNTRYAQGGLSAAVGEDDSPRLHEADTLSAGAGLCDPDAVRVLVDGAPQAVEWLISIGAQFDRDATGNILLGREAAHSRRRVLHAGGDATGAEIERALVAEARRRPNIEVWHFAFALDLIVEHGAVVGALIEDEHGQRWQCDAPVTVIAAGGAGQLWSTTSNPSGATADGLAMAIRAGATVADCEFVQFHPTVLALTGWDAFLVSEAVRGEGAYLRNDAGERFMIAEHPLAELAPRDVVARGIHRQLKAGKGACLDVRHLDAGEIRARFPTIARELATRGLDLATDLIPVAPAAHYFMGGIAANDDGATSLPGLLALGEASCTGIHGANRLASNSLLEGLVFGRFAAERAARLHDPVTRSAPAAGPATGGEHLRDQNPARTAELRGRAQALMSEDVGVDRNAAGMQAALVGLSTLADEARRLGRSQPEIEVINMITSAQAIAGAALHRLESRGAHYRSDAPATNPALDGQHSLLDGGADAWRYGALSDAFAPVVTGTRR